MSFTINKRQIVLFLSGITLLMMFACKNSEQVMFPYNFDEEIKTSATKEVNIDMVETFSYMRVKNNNIIIFSNSANHFINVFDINTGEKKHSYLSKGRGRGEIVTPMNIFVDNNSDKVEIFDNGRQMYYVYDFATELNKGESFSYTNTKNLFTYFSAFSIKDSIFLGMSMLPNRMFDLVNNGKVVNSFFSYPNALDKPKQQGLPFAYQGAFYPNKDKTKFFYASTYCDIFELYNFDGAILTKVKRYQSYNPKYKDSSVANRLSATIDKSNKDGFMSFATTDKYIYLLFSGKSMVSHPNNYNYCNQVYVIDWDGNLVRKLILDTEVYNICVSADDTVLYGAKERGDDSFVLQFDIK